MWNVDACMYQAKNLGMTFHLLRNLATITRFSNSEYYNIHTLLAGQNSHKYANGRNPLIELGDGPVRREEGSRTSKVGRAESGTESIVFGAIFIMIN